MYSNTLNFLVLTLVYVVVTSFVGDISLLKINTELIL